MMPDLSFQTLFLSSLLIVHMGRVSSVHPKGRSSPQIFTERAGKAPYSSSHEATVPSSSEQLNVPSGLYFLAGCSAIGVFRNTFFGGDCRLRTTLMRSP